MKRFRVKKRNIYMTFNAAKGSYVTVCTGPTYVWLQPKNYDNAFPSWEDACFSDEIERKYHESLEDLN